MNFPATEFQCDSVYAIAVRPLYQLCATTPQGQCRNGACTTEDCIPQVGNACDQTNGMGNNAMAITAAYAVTGLLYFMWAYSGVDIKEDYVAVKTYEHKNTEKNTDHSDWM